MNLVRTFFPKSAHFPLNFEKGQGRPPPLLPSNYAPELCYTKQAISSFHLNAIISTLYSLVFESLTE